MNQKLSDYIADFLAQSGITDVFTVTGGGAMHLNDSLGHHERLRCTYNHHEQACAIAAESYARIHGRIAAVCVTTGPGGINALTGVAGGWLDSVPMLIISGQVRYDTTARSTGLGIRAMGDQEFDICAAAKSMTKYCEVVIDKSRIRYCLEKALYLAQNGRPGPCWLDIPLDIQGAFTETDGLIGYDESEYESTLPSAPSDALLLDIIEKIRQAERPVFNVGSGVRGSDGFEVFGHVAEKLNMPLVTGWNSIDAVHDSHPLYTGRAGIMGDRAGNFAVQNSDLLLSVGSRLSIRQVGYNYKTWAREAYTIVVDIDAEELKKPTLHVDMPVHADAKAFLKRLDALLPGDKLTKRTDWLKQCRAWKQNYPVVQPKHCAVSGGYANVYCFIKELSRRLPEGQVTVVGNGSACVVGSHAFIIKQNQRFIINSAIASMGYDLPAAIGACIANGRRETICVTGDGSIQMNLQELQTIIHNRLPIKIFIINNGGYHSIRQTQRSFFGEPFVGIGVDSGDLSFPDMGKLAWAYGYPYLKIESNRDMGVLDKALAADGLLICEVFVDREQNFEPKSATKRLPDGTLVSAPLEDMAPFLPKDELAQNMYIKIIE
ncbi:MAG: thiamine pyrophosphate-binding protein [Oscillospiraceae bacterium]|nr:thiamine pyrophosphate-binding protein [Oscillospiraceae bacterium]